MSELRALFGTPDVDEYRKKLAAALVTQGTDASAVRSPLQGANRLAQALLGGMMMNDLASESNKTRQENIAALRTAVGLGPPDSEPLSGVPSAPPGAFQPPAQMPPPNNPPSKPGGGSYNGPGVKLSSNMVGYDEGVKLGYYDPEPPRKESSGRPSPMPPASLGPMTGTQPQPQQPPVSFDDRFGAAFAQATPPTSGSSAAPATQMPPQAPRAPQGNVPPSAVSDPRFQQRINALLNQGTDAALRQAQLMLDEARNQKNQFMQTPDGTILSVNPRENTATPIYNAAVKPMTVGRDDRLVNPITGQQIVAAGPEKPPAGYRQDPNNQNALQAIEGGPATHLPQGAAGQIAMMDTAAKELPAARAILEQHWGISPMSLGNRVSSAFGIGDVGRAQRTVEVAIEGALRAMTGAAAPAAEVQSYKDKFMPNQFDTPQTTKQKLDNLETFMQTARGMMMQGRMPASNNNVAQKPDPLGIR